MTLRRPAALFLVLLALACHDPVGPPPKITALPRSLTTSEQQIIAADNRFAIKLLKQATIDTRDTLTNLFVSPLSVAMALGMAYNGAAGTTEDAMRTTLELDGMSVAEVNESYRSLIALLRELDPQVRFQIANSIWYLQGYRVEQAFLDANRTYYDATVEALDFASPTAPVTINNWVSQQTHGVIDRIVDQIPDGMRPTWT
jgi:serpin B